MGMGTRILRLITATALAAFAIVFASRDAAAGERLRIVVPDGENLQYMSFWVAQATAAFAEEGLDVEVSSPAAPGQTATFFEEGEAEAAVLPPPLYLRMIARRAPIVLVANLLANDPIELVVKRSVLAERKLDASMPLRARLEGVRGLRIGIAPHPPVRLRALFASEGLDADRDIEMVILHGKQQNAAFRGGEVDALFAHTPFVERAIVHDDAVVLIDLSRGDAPPLANRMIHALAFKRTVLAQRRDLAVRAFRAIARAQALLHASPRAAADALAKKMPARDRREIDTIVDLYAPAIPRTPEVHADQVTAALAFFPAGQPPPDLAGVPLAEHVATDLAEDATGAPPFRTAWLIVIAVALAVVLAVALAVRPHFLRQKP